MRWRRCLLNLVFKSVNCGGIITNMEPTQKIPASRLGDPPWEIAMIFPEQGAWDESDFFGLRDNRSLELNDGMIEVLPLPKKTHEKIVLFLAKFIEAYVIARAIGGLVLASGYKLRTGRKNYRQPDVIYMTAEQDARSNEDFTTEAELVVEVVSPDDPSRDYIKKRKEYATAGIPEYWIVDPKKGQIVILRLQRGVYREHGCFFAGQQAISHRFPGLAVSVDDVLNLRR